MEIRHKPRRNRSSKLPPWSILFISTVILLLLFIGIYILFTNQTSNTKIWSTTTTTQLTNPLAAAITRTTSSSGGGSRRSGSSKVFYPTSNEQTATKLIQDLQNCDFADPIALDIKNPPDFMSSCGPDVDERFQILTSSSSKQPHLAMELLKYCALSLYPGSSYIDSESPLMVSLDTLLSTHENVAILNDPFLPRTIHGSFLILHDITVAKDMLQILVTTNIQVLESNPLLLPKSLYDIIALRAGVGKLSAGPNNNDSNNSRSKGKGDGDWYLWQHSCTVNPLGDRQVTAPISNYALQSYRITQNCPEPNGFCCSIFDPIQHMPIMVTKHLLLPYQVLPHANHLPKPLNAEAGHYEEEDLPFIATIAEQIRPRLDGPIISPNFFDILLQNDCLPSDKACSDCLRDKKGANCKKCANACPCYCKTLCHVSVEEKFISKVLTVRPPLYARDPSRLIPRIVHQTWFEDVSSDKYPNMSRLIESFKQSGWEYKFYTDDEAANFLSTHYPPEIRQAYDALRPGAFKADLFRYCVLLIEGGVYADVDILLNSNLDVAVGPDVGFMVPQDEPGTPVNRRMCLWNGFIAAAPGHPFLAKVIETVVNNVRNRYTSVDVDNLFCPEPELSILHAFDTLFTAGPCILGAMVNKVLGRNAQTPFEAGETDIWEASKNAAVEKGAEFVIGVDDKPSSRIPGRTIILHQNKWDMGAHRFSLLEKNLVVAATDLPDADDRANQEKPPEHYSKTHVKAGIYGLERLYVDNVKANEEIRFVVDGKWKTFSNN